MIDSLELKRFRSIKEADLNFRDINILIGRNNTGKSSVLYALDLLINNFGESFAFDNTESDLGTLPENVHKQENEGEVFLDIGLDFAQDKLDEISTLASRHFQHNIPEFTFLGTTATIPVPSNIAEGNVNEVNLDAELYGDGGAIVTLDATGDETMDWDDSQLDVAGFPPMVVSGTAGETGVFDHIEDMFREFKSSRFFYIHPNRLQRDRIRMISETPRHRDVGDSGRYVTDVMAYNRDYVELEEHFNKSLDWINEFGFEEAKAKLEQGAEHSLQLVDEDLGVQTNILDIGSGTNQLVSLITQSFFAPSRSVLLVEEPEIHLHPRYQASLADFFIEAQSFGEHQFFLETHSQHLLARLQLRIAEDIIDPAQIGLFFFEKDEDGSKIHQIQIDQAGEVDGGIPEFFEQDFDDVMERMKTMREKQDSQSE